MNIKQKGQVFGYRKHDDKKTSWSEMILSDSGKTFYIRDYQTSFLNSVEISNMHIIGTLIEFESTGDLVTKVISIEAPKKVCSCCSHFVVDYETEESFNSAMVDFTKLIQKGDILLKNKSNSLDINFDESKYEHDPNFTMPSSYYDFQFQSFLCNSCKSIFIANSTERSNLYARISYVKYPFSICKM